MAPRSTAPLLRERAPRTEPSTVRDLRDLGDLWERLPARLPADVSDRFVANGRETAEREVREEATWRLSTALEVLELDLPTIPGTRNAVCAYVCAPLCCRPTLHEALRHEVRMNYMYSDHMRDHHMAFGEMLYCLEYKLNARFGMLDGKISTEPQKLGEKHSKTRVLGSDQTH